MKYKKSFYLLFILCLSFCLMGCQQHSEIQNTLKDMTVSFINIGKGDAFLLDIPNSGYYMVDTGKKEDYSRIEQVLKKKGVQKLEGIFLSHGHKDHVGCFKKIVKEIPTQKVYISGKDHSSYNEIDVKKIANENHVEVVELQGGEELEFGQARIHVWIPPREDFKNENNNSVVMHMQYGEVSMLFTGDMEEKEEMLLLQEHFPLKANILKLGHHGEDDATSLRFLKSVSPSYGLITGNKEENPESVNEITEEKMKQFHVKTYYSQGKQICKDFIMNGKDINIKDIME